MLRRLDIFPERFAPGAEAVYVWGAEYEECAAAFELEGLPVLRLDSGGFCAAWSAAAGALIQAGRYRIAHERLPWRVVEWRERGRALFKDTVVEVLEQEHSTEVAWGTDGYEAAWRREVDRVIAETAARLRLAAPDEVLVMCVWRVFDRELALLGARYGLGDDDDDTARERVLDMEGASGAERERLSQLHGAALAWW